MASESFFSFPTSDSALGFDQMTLPESSTKRRGEGHVLSADKRSVSFMTVALYYYECGVEKLPRETARLPCKPNDLV